MILIDPSTRQFNIPGSELVFGVESDAGSERKYFQCPRYVGDNLDLASCFVRMNFRNANGEMDSYLVDDVTAKGDNVEFSWVLSQKAVLYKGHVKFVVCAVGPNQKVEWHTTLGTGMVLEGLEPDAAVVEVGTADVVAQLIAMVETQTAAVETVGETWVKNVKSEGATQVAAVRSAAETAEAAAVAEIEAKGVNTLATIPEDYTALQNAVDALNRSRGPMIVCEAAGESVVIGDSSDLPMQGLRVFGKTAQVTTTGKNLLEVSEENAIYVNGYKNYTVNNGVIKITNVALFAFKMPVVYGTGYAFSFKKNATETTCHFRVYEYGAEPVAIAGDDPNYIGTPINSACAGETVVVKNYTPSAESVTWVAVGFYTTQVNTVTEFMAELGTQATTYEHYTGGQPSPSPDYPQELVSLEPVVSVIGRQIFDVSRFADKTYGGVTLTNNGDGSLSISGSGNLTANFSVNYRLTSDEVRKLVKPGRIYVSYGAVTYPYFEIQVIQDGVKVRSAHNSTDAYIDYMDITEEMLNSGTMMLAVYIYGVKDHAIIPGTVKLSIYQDGDGVWEPYKAPQTLEITHALPGIPVASGGNYTDADGQEWICDEVDLERGVYVQRVGKMVFDGTEYWQLGEQIEGTRDGVFFINRLLPSPSFAYCSHYRFTDGAISANNARRGYFDMHYGQFRCNSYGFATVEAFTNWLKENPLTILYPAENPNETNLSETEIAAYRDLHSNYPNTTVLNDAGAHMVVKYAADTKLYIDNKIKEALQ